MIRRHAAGPRLLMMTGDALLSVVLFAALSIWRFGPDWAVLWRQVVPEPVAFLALGAFGCVFAPAKKDLRWHAGRWSLRSEAVSHGRKPLEAGGP